MNDRRQKILIFDLDDTLFDSTNQPPYTEDAWAIQLFDGFQSILASPDYRHILVTKGNADLQNKKIDTLGIRDYFADIYIVESDEHKHGQFAAIKNNFSDADIFVVGNRIDAEIRYGNLLGLKTIHIRHGKYETLLPKDQYELPTKALGISEILNLKDFL